ncbi:MAG: lysylphosphatidylglycerol synthase domain-containing protein, partial [Methanoregula sp.]
MYRKISAILIPSLIAVGILAYMLYQVWDNLLVSLQHIVPVYLGIAVLLCLAAWWLRGWRYHRILLGLNYRVKVAVTTACVFVSQTVNLIVPARLGDFVR